MSTTHHIKITDITESDLTTIISDLSNLYQDSGFTKTISIYRKKGNPEIYSLIFSESPDFERFCYFINYLRYPESIKELNPKVKGYIHKSLIRESGDFKIGEWFQVFVPENDSKYNVVHFINEQNQLFEYDFGGQINNLGNGLFKKDVFYIDDYHFITDIYSEKSFNENFQEIKPWWKFW